MFSVCFSLFTSQTNFSVVLKNVFSCPTLTDQALNIEWCREEKNTIHKCSLPPLRSSYKRRNWRYQRNRSVLDVESVACIERKKYPRKQKKTNPCKSLHKKIFEEKENLCDNYLDWKLRWVWVLKEKSERLKLKGNGKLIIGIIRAVTFRREIRLQWGINSASSNMSLHHNYCSRCPPANFSKNCSANFLTSMICVRQSGQRKARPRCWWEFNEVLIDCLLVHVCACC